LIRAKTKDGRVIEVPDSERQECEIWTRVMGYYRPVSEFNIGKKAEHAERVLFRESASAEATARQAGGVNA